jgi:hypothetical protein
VFYQVATRQALGSLREIQMLNPITVNPKSAEIERGIRVLQSKARNKNNNHMFAALTRKMPTYMNTNVPYNTHNVNIIDVIC